MIFIIQYKKPEDDPPMAHFKFYDTENMELSGDPVEGLYYPMGNYQDITKLIMMNKEAQSAIASSLLQALAIPPSYSAMSLVVKFEDFISFRDKNLKAFAEGTPTNFKVLPAFIKKVGNSSFRFMHLTEYLAPF